MFTIRYVGKYSLLTIADLSMWIFHKRWSELCNCTTSWIALGVNPSSIALFNLLRIFRNSRSLWILGFQSNNGGSMLSTQGRYATSAIACKCRSGRRIFAKLNNITIQLRILGTGFITADFSSSEYFKRWGSNNKEQMVVAVFSNRAATSKGNENQQVYVGKTANIK